MNTAKELAQIVQLRKSREAQMFYARQYAGPWANGMKKAVARRNVRKQVAERPVTLVMAALMSRIDSARQGAIRYANKQIEMLTARLAAEHGNVNAIAPEMPRGDIWDRRYQLEREIAIYFRAWVFGVTKATVAKPESYEPQWAREARERIREIDPEGVERYVKECIEDAEYNYLEFVFKMDKKVGEVTYARMHDEGLDVWGSSYLIVTKPDGSEVIWFTQQIQNRSKLGRYFPQWPSRIVKEIR